MTIWDILQIEATTDLKAIKLAYARLLKKYHPEDNADDFQRLRQAYELALAYAAGKTVNIELDDQAATEPSATKSAATEQSATETLPSPTDVAFYVLDQLNVNAEQAVSAMQDVKQKGYFDNLMFSEGFQHAIAINCLPIVHQQIPFIDYLIHFFNWLEMAENYQPKNMMHIAVLNLIHATRDYRFYMYLENLAAIKNRKEALKKEVEWPDCVAAKSILQKPKPIKFRLISRLRRQQLEKIYGLLDQLRDDYPNLIGRINLDSYYWWRKRKRGDLSVNFYKIICYLCMLFLASCVIFAMITRDDAVKPKPDAKTAQVSSTAAPENEEYGKTNLITEAYMDKYENSTPREEIKALEKIIASNK